MESVAVKVTLSVEQKGEGTQDTSHDVFVMPATPGQTRFWTMQKAHAGNRGQVIPLAWTCKGPFNHDAARSTLAELIRRHESLRTTFQETGNTVSQVIHPAFELGLPLEDLRPLPPAERGQQADAIIREEANAHLDMERGPLFKARLIQMGEEDHILLLTSHHSICDGWSNGVLLRDFTAIYDSQLRQVAPEIPNLPIQFGDYAVWLDEWRKSKEKTASLEYWRKALGGNFTPLQIPHESSSGEQEQGGELETLLLSSDLTHRVRDFCAERGVTLYMFFLSVYAMALNRMTGQEDLLIGTPSANRRPGTEDLIGLFFNPQLVRIHIDEETSFNGVLEQVRTWTLNSIAHQDLPYEDVYEDSFFSTEQNHIPEHVYFLYQKAFMQVQHVGSLEIAPLVSLSPGALYDLMLSIVERTEGPRLQLEYNRGSFRASTVQWILQLNIHILQFALDGANRPIRSLPLLKEDEAPPAIFNEHGKLRPEVRELAVIPAEAADSAEDQSTGTGEKGRATGKSRDENLAPSGPLELQVAEIWEAAIGCKIPSTRVTFFELGGRSLAAMRIVARINRIYGLDFGLATLLTGNTVERMAELIEQRLSANTTSAIVAMKGAGSAAPLFILHGAGGNIIRFFQLATLVQTEHPVYGIQAQSLLAGQPALLRLEDQAAYYLEEMRKIQPHGPYYFLGYSFGGTTALEMAHQLRAMGEDVELLGMLDSRQRDYMAVMRKKDSVRSRFDRRIARFLGNFNRLSTKDKFAYIAEKLFTRTLRHTYRLAVAMGFRSVPSWMKSTDDISWVAAMNYQTRPWPGQITLFRASEQPDPRFPRDLGWTHLAKGGMEIYELPGDHDRLFSEANIHVLADQLRSRLEQSDRAAKAS